MRSLLCRLGLHWWEQVENRRDDETGSYVITYARCVRKDCPYRTPMIVNIDRIRTPEGSA